ncbi:MAG: type II toxin-antitoxin system HigB family toxin [Thermoleophilia bacterium]
MRVIARATLKHYWESHPAVEGQLRAWFQEAKAAKWGSPADVNAQYASASILADNRVVFNIGGNSYRLVVHINYELQIVYVKFIGTHGEYDNIDATTV